MSHKITFPVDEVVDATGIPNEEFPSDHFPLYGRMVFKM